MNRNLLATVKFDFIRYANCWEDADVLLEGLGARPGGRILSIASGGDNSFSLLTTDPEFVLAVDVNPVQLRLVAFKRAAIQRLDRSAFLELLGFYPSDNRQELYREVRPAMSAETRQFWDDNWEMVKHGLIFSGKFEKYFLLFVKKALPFIHSRERVKELLAKKTQEEQQAFYLKMWNTWRWRMLFRLFFSRFVIGRYGRDPAFFENVKSSVSKNIFQKAEKVLLSTRAQDNYMLHFNLTGSFNGRLPHYARAGHYQKIKENINRLRIVLGLAQDAAIKYGKFDYFNLSDIFEYMDESAFSKAARQIQMGASQQARLAYWNFLVPRKLSDRYPANFRFQEELSRRLQEIDQGFFYDQFIIDESIQTTI